jgi:hypothetical protein
MPRPWPSGNDPADGRTVDLLDSVVGGVFAAALRLEAAIDLSGGRAGQDMSEALRCLDEVVRQVRDHVFAVQSQRATAPRPDPRDRAELGAARAALVQERMASLRQQVIDRANALQVAAEETACLLEQRDGLLGQPTRIDLPTEIKRWRVVADQARRAAQRLERLQNQ